MRVGILSDTHGLLRPEVIEKLEGCDLILHAGDINKQELIEKLEQIAPVKVVRGNNDKEWAKNIPYVLNVECQGLQILMCHKKNEVPRNRTDIDLVVFGHSHKYEDKLENGVRWINPGSCGPRRFNQEITMAIMEINKNGNYEIHRIDIFHREKPVKLPVEKDRAAIIKAVVKGIEKGLTTDQIAKKNCIDTELVQEISRMYLTHPGIDVDGILNRIK